MLTENILIAGILIIILAYIAVAYGNKLYNSKKVEEVLFDENDTLQALKLSNSNIAKDFSYLGDINFSSTHLQHLLGETLDLSCGITGKRIKYVILFKSNLFLIYENDSSKKDDGNKFEVWGKTLFKEFNAKLDEVFYEYYLKLSNIITNKKYLDEKEYIMIATMMPQFKQYLIKVESPENIINSYKNINYKQTTST
jgi:hypothetical protein